MIFEYLLVSIVIFLGFLGFFPSFFFNQKEKKKLSNSCLDSTCHLTKQENINEKTQTKKDQTVFVKTCREFFYIFCFVLCFRSFGYEFFRIPSGSMIPTLLIGDTVVVNKHAYTFKLPVLNTILYRFSSPQKGDVVVFLPPKSSQFFVKRIVGLPGDKIEYNENGLTINGKKQVVQHCQKYNDKNQQWDGDLLCDENLFGKIHSILNHPSGNDPKSYGSFIVPEHHYFMMGDNRNNSYDSRYWGVVSDNHIQGKVNQILFNFHHQNRWWKFINK